MAELQAAPKICRSCGQPNKFDAVRCAGCNSDRFAPHWVRALRKVAKGFSVQVNEPFEREDPHVPTLTLFKWWPGGRVSFHIREQEHWRRVKQIVDGELLPVLGWNGVNGSGQAGDAPVAEAGPLEARLPRALAALAAVEPKEFEAVDLETLEGWREELSAVLARLDRAQVAAVKAAAEGVSDSTQTASRQLGELTSREAVAERQAIAIELRRRLALLEVIEHRLADERSYKVVNHRTAANRLLEQALWLVDDAWWFSDETDGLRRKLDAKAEEKDKRYARKPLDFACGLRHGRLLAVKALPPGRQLEPMDLVGLEANVADCREMATISEFEMVLIGAGVTDELTRLVELRGGDTRILTYRQVLDDCRGRCQRRLEQLGLAA